jgi:hypothetical protein
VALPWEAEKGGQVRTPVLPTAMVGVVPVAISTPSPSVSLLCSLRPPGATPASFSGMM